MEQPLGTRPAEERIESYRGLAAALRRMAENTSSETLCSELATLAASYETLALKVARIEESLPIRQVA
ncbi:MAG TPA: hypothetical protein VGI20_05615 [Rhizomicrobium sp.]|jgi:hypothetical protein